MEITLHNCSTITETRWILFIFGMLLEEFRMENHILLQLIFTALILSLSQFRLGLVTISLDLSSIQCGRKIAVKKLLRKQSWQFSKLFSIEMLEPMRLSNSLLLTRMVSALKIQLRLTPNGTSKDLFRELTKKYTTNDLDKMPKYHYFFCKIFVLICSDYKCFQAVDEITFFTE